MVIGTTNLPSAPVSSAAATTSLHVDTAAFRGEGDLAFVSIDALYVLDGTTGRLVELSGENSGASDPTFSPDGRWLLYETENGAQSWLARADGTHRRRLARVASFLPDGRLSMGGETYVVTASGALRSAGSMPSTVLTTTASGTSVFLSNTMRVDPSKPSKGVVRIETASSADGPRTLWYQAHVSFSASGGLEGTFPGNVTVLPGHRGLVLTISSWCCDHADGQPIYELRRPLARPVLLGMVLGAATAPSLGPDDTFALAGGGDRYAWSDKHVELCNEITARCVVIVAAPGRLSLSPAWSPDARTLAFVDAKAEPEGEIGQAQVNSWYATHHLYLLSAGAALAAGAGGAGAAAAGAGARAGATHGVEVPDTTGAAAPMWSASSTSLLYVDHDALYLIAHPGTGHPGTGPVEIAGPLFVPSDWTSYYGEVDWSSQFAWSEGARS